MDAAMDRMRIGIVGLGSGAGTGFTAVSLARFLSLQGGFRPAVLELGKGGLYDSLGMDRHFAGRQFFAFHEAAAADKSIRGRRNEHLGVNWMLLPAGGEVSPPLDLFRKLRLIHNALGDVILCRLAGVEDSELWPLLQEMDRILIVIDPLPSKMLAGYPFLCRLRVADLPLFYLVNRYNEGVSRKEMGDFLAVKGLFYLPAIEAKEIYGAEYACRCIYDMPLAARELRKPLDRLAAALLADPAES